MSIQKNKIFLQDWGTYEGSTLVCVGTNFDRMRVWLKKNKLTKNWLDPDTVEVTKNIFIEGLTVNFKDGDSLLWLRRYSYKKWFDIETLLHEVHHLVFFDARNKSQTNEHEAQAYQYVYLFRNIRNKLQ